MQHVSQVENLLETLDPEGNDITILGEEFGDYVWNKWVHPHLSNHSKAPGTLCSYLTSLEKFFTFITSNWYLRKEMPPLHGNYFDIFKGTMNALKGWRATIDNETQDIQHRGHLKECDTLLTEHDITEIEKSKPYIDGVKAIAQAKAGKQLSNQEFTDARDLLLVKLALLVGSRPAPLENALVEDYENAEEKDGNRVMLIPKHKRSRAGPAPLGMDKEVQELMQVYVDKIRPTYAAKDVKHLFVKNDGQHFNRNTIGKRFSAFFQKSGIRSDKRISQTSVRKSVTTATRKHAPQEMANIQRVLCHGEKSSRNSYLRLDMTESTSHAMNVIKNVRSKESKSKSTASKKDTKTKAYQERSEEREDLDVPGPSNVDCEVETASTNVVPPTDSPGKMSKLTDKEKQSIRETFLTAIERGQKQGMKEVRNKMSTTLVLRKMTQSLSKVKQVTNFVNYLIVSRPSNATDLSDLPTEPVKVDKWLDEESLKSGPRQYWDTEDTRTLETEFSKFKKSPTKKEMRDMFTKNEHLAAICTKEGFDRCYEKVKTIMKKMKKITKR